MKTIRGRLPFPFPDPRPIALPLVPFALQSYDRTCARPKNAKEKSQRERDHKRLESAKGGEWEDRLDGGASDSRVVDDLHFDFLFTLQVEYACKALADLAKQ
jgi:hypothetical protein